MKKSHITILGLTALASLVHAGHFITPTASYVHPIDSSATVYGMPATVKYSDGQSFGIGAGRTFGRFNLYANYDYTSFKAKEICVQTPYGLQTQGLSDDYNAHTVLACADYTSPISKKIALVGGLGVGYSFSEQNSIVYQVLLGVQRSVGASDVSLGVSYRVTPKAIHLAHKDIEQPSQIRLTLGWRF